MIKEKPTIIVDTREKTPWDWEGDDSFAKVIHTKLEGGDYSLVGMEEILAIERKASVDELYINFTEHKVRFAAEWDRLKDHKIKILIVEASCEDILNPYQYYVNKKKINKKSPRMPVAVVASGLTNLMLERGVQVIFGGDRSQAMIRGILLRAWELHQKGLLD